MTSNKKPRFILISDLWGDIHSDWISYYTKALDNYFEIKLYSSPELAEITTNNQDQNQIHQKFLDGGIETAVKNLLKIEKESIYILAFSIGGTIAWKTALKGLNVQNLFAISATRLRLETEKPNAKTELFFGEVDSNRPEDEWFENLEIKKHFIKDQSHEMYKDRKIAHDICSRIINDLASRL